MRRRSLCRISVTTGVMASDSKLIPPVYSAASSGLRPAASDLETEFDEARRRLPLGFFVVSFITRYTSCSSSLVNKQIFSNMTC